MLLTSVSSCVRAASCVSPPVKEKAGRVRPFVPLNLRAFRSLSLENLPTSNLVLQHLQEGEYQQRAHAPFNV